ncbi:hypothetical protein TNCV_2851801 [Trichonephila clavipes]|nr:hypothetical protein TNCV_2851801 [Trichonephila clavipes]
MTCLLHLQLILVSRDFVSEFERSGEPMVRHILEERTVCGRALSVDKGQRCTTINAGDRWPVPDTCAVVISTETESGFITEDDTSLFYHTPSPRSAKSSRPRSGRQPQSSDHGSERSSRSFVFLGRPDPTWSVAKKPTSAVR